MRLRDTNDMVNRFDSVHARRDRDPSGHPFGLTAVATRLPMPPAAAGPADGVGTGAQDEVVNPAPFSYLLTSTCWVVWCPASSVAMMEKVLRSFWIATSLDH